LIREEHEQGVQLGETEGEQGDKKSTRTIREVRLADSEGVATVGNSMSKRGNKGRRRTQEAEPNLSRWHMICRVGSDRGSRDQKSEERWGDRRERTLGAEGVIPGRYIVSFLRVFKQFTHTLPSR